MVSPSNLLSLALSGIWPLFEDNYPFQQSIEQALTSSCSRPSYSPSGRNDNNTKGVA